jgi:NTE family protein
MNKQRFVRKISSSIKGVTCLELFNSQRLLIGIYFDRLEYVKTTTMKRFYITVVLLLCFFGSYATVGDSTVQKRPKIGLVLSGGGAKGMAHVGVLKVLEELGIEPDYITGVSFGSIVGGLYSIGYNTEQLDSICVNLDWGEALSDVPDYDEINVDTRNNFKKYHIALSGNNLRQIELPSGVVQGQSISEILSYLTWRSHLINNFDDYPIPFRCLATDLITGQPYTFREGSLVEAMRSSMAIPSAFTPVTKDTLLLVDGGVINNYPVQECLDMGADIIIGVYVGFDKNVAPKDLNTMVKVMARTSSFLGTLNSRKEMFLVDINIVPELQDYGAENFSKAQMIIDLGEDAARDEVIYESLVEVSTLLQSYDEPVPRRVLYDNQKIQVNKIVIEGLNTITKEAFLNKAHIKPGDRVGKDEMQEALNRLYGSLLYDKVEYRFSKTIEGIELKFLVDEKDGSRINASINYNSTFGLTLRLEASRQNLFINSSKLIIKGDISYAPRFELTYNMFSGPRNRIKWTFGMYGQSVRVPNFYSINDSIIIKSGYYRSNDIELFASTNWMITNKTQLGIKFGRKFTRLNLNDGIEDLYNTDFVRYRKYTLEGKLLRNAYNDPIFPTKGSDLTLMWRFNFDPHVDEDEDINSLLFEDYHNYHTIVFDYKKYFRLNRSFSLYTGLTIGLMSDIPMYTDKFYLGGFYPNTRPNTFPLVGVEVNDVATDNFISGMIGMRYNIENRWFVDLFAQQNAFLDNSNSFSNNSVGEEGDVLSGWGVNLGYKSIVGPCFLTLTQNAETNNYLFNFGFGYKF